MIAKSTASGRPDGAPDRPDHSTAAPGIPQGDDGSSGNTSGIGVSLAAARLRRGLSLEEVSRRTKIGVGSLLAIERDRFTDLPGGIYLRGMLRAFAREVG